MKTKNVDKSTIIAVVILTIVAVINASVVWTTLHYFGSEFDILALVFMIAALIGDVIVMFSCVVSLMVVEMDKQK